ncbi:MAG TPA: hypothetical protein VLZ81_10970 [Blastocatellia bacterium]|nr:hypothetical protein [Blastocatellia bacterium]
MGRFSKLFVVAAVLALPIISHSGVAQEHSEDTTEKAAALIKASIGARGGDKYMNVQTVVSRGQYTPFVKGKTTVPQRFVDYIVYPDKERVEFGSGDQKRVETNVGNTGWAYSGESRLIRDQKDDEIKLYVQLNRYDIDAIIRHGWHDQDAKLAYIPRKEVWAQTFAEGVKVDFSDGGSETIYFDRQTKLPLVNEYKIVTEDGTKKDSVRYYQWMDFDGVKFAHIQDAYSDNVQIARTYFESIRVNESVPEKLFAKPANAKEVK